MEQHQERRTTRPEKADSRPMTERSYSSPDYGPPLLIDGERYCPNCRHPLTDLGTNTQWSPHRLWRCTSGVDPETQEPLDLSGYEWIGNTVRKETKMQKEDRMLGTPAHELPIVMSRAWCVSHWEDVEWRPSDGTAVGHGHIGADECCSGCPGPYVALRIDRSQSPPTERDHDADGRPDTSAEQPPSTDTDQPLPDPS